MKACVLNSSEAAQLEHQSRIPVCDNHQHLSFGEAMIKVLSGNYRFVTAPDDKSNRRITKATEIARWAGHPSVIRTSRGRPLGFMQVMQAIPKHRVSR